MCHRYHKEMEEPQYQHARISHEVGSDLYGANYVRGTNENKIWESTNTMRTSSSWDTYVLSPPKREHSMKKTKTDKTWWWNDPQRKRTRRVAKYKFYAAEGKIKRSLKKGFRWLKIKCINIMTDV